MPDPQKVLATLQRAENLFRNTPGRRGSVVHLDNAEEVMVVGDLHGHIGTFSQVLKLAKLEAHSGRHLILQELVHDPRADPDDDIGDLSHRLVDVVCALKCQFPTRVHYLPGNHELSEVTRRSIAKNRVPLNALFLKGIESDYGPAAGAIHAAYQSLFAALPLAVRTPNRVLVVHTIPEGRDLETFDPAIFEADVWPTESLARGGSVYGLTWGRDSSPETADRFAAIVDIDFFVNGHQPVDEGFRVANHRQLIVDGTPPRPGLVLFSTREPMSMERLRAGVKLLATTG